jgi:hypothetical protein
MMVMNTNLAEWPAGKMLIPKQSPFWGTLAMASRGCSKRIGVEKMRWLQNIKFRGAFADSL